MSAPLEAALLMVAAELRDGDDVNHRLTRRHFKAGFNDVLRNDLGVQHLHVGPRDQGLDTTRRHRMCGAMDELLWVVIRDDDAYLVELLGHHAFNTFDFANVIYGNWKHLLGEPLDGWTVDDSDAFNAETRARFRSIGLFTVVSFEGKAFMPGGFMKDGTSGDVIRAAHATLNGITDMYRWIEEHPERVLKQVQRKAPTSTELRLKAGDLESLLQGQVSLVEQNSGVTFYADGEGVRCG